METYKIIYQEQARRDIAGIARYIAVTLENQTAAVHITGKIKEVIEKTAKNPYTNPIYYPLEPLRGEYRKAIAENYMIFYRVDEAERAIKIFRVIYGKRDLRRQLKSEE